MKRYLILLFLLLHFSTLFSYESSRYIYEKHWYISGESGAVYTLNATFLVNDSEQKVSSISLSEGQLIKEGNNLIFFSNRTFGEVEREIIASAVVETNYNPFLENDFPLSSFPIPDSQIEEQAQELSDSSSTAKTLLSFTKWIYDNMEYNTLYANITDPEEIFEERKGVCVAYSNLLYYFLNYTHIESRKISGYSKSIGWLPHTWLEVRIGEQWLSVDPTYNQIGALSSDHVKTYAGPSERSDTIHSFGDLYNFSSESKLSESYSKELEVPLEYSYDVNNNTIEIVLLNPSEQYLFASFYFLFPEGWGENVNEVLFFSPFEEKTLLHNIEPEESLGIDENSLYSVPFVFSVMGEESEGAIQYNPSTSEGNKENVCPVSLFLILPSFFLLQKYDILF